MKEVIISQKIKVDECIAQEIVYLNSIGVHTINCCCGHGELKPQALIKPSSRKEAINQGYNPSFDESLGYSGEWGIYLKSECV